MRLTVLAAAVLLSACLDHTPDRAHVWIDAVDAGEDGGAQYLRAARAWEALGFAVDLESSGAPSCGAERDASCEVKIELYRPSDLVETHGSDALSLIGTRIVAIDARMVDPGRLRIAVAHEVGHVLLHTPGHPRVARGEMAIMAGTWSLITDLDRAFACESLDELCE